MDETILTLTYQKRYDVAVLTGIILTKFGVAPEGTSRRMLTKEVGIELPKHSPTEPGLQQIFGWGQPKQLAMT